VHKLVVNGNGEKIDSLAGHIESDVQSTWARRKTGAFGHENEN